MRDPHLDDPSRFLAHYTRADIAFSHILPSGKLKMSPYAAMRDPFENKRPALAVAKPTAHDDDWDPAPDVWGKHFRYTQIADAIARTRDQLRLLSLTQGDKRLGTDAEAPFRQPWSRPRMWEQYGEIHAGVCLVFDKAQLVSSIQAELSRAGVYWEGDVIYTVAGFAASEGALIAPEDFAMKHLPDDARRHVEEHSRDFFFLKTEDWASEFEYRFVLQDSNGAGLADAATPRYVSYGNALRYVVIGERFPSWQVEGARKAVRWRRLHRIVWDEGFPQLAEVRG